MESDYNDENVFAKILRRELPARVVYEDNEVMCFHDVHPQAKIHCIIVPKGQYQDFNAFIKLCDVSLVGSFFAKIYHIADLLGVTSKGYRLVTNNGKAAGQVVPHFHVHIMSGAGLNEESH